MDYLRVTRLKQRIIGYFGYSYAFPLETFTLILHYKVASAVFFLLFSAITSGFYAMDPMECVSKFDRSKPPAEFEEICLTYPYTFKDKDGNGKLEWTDRVYALHYKWIHWAMLCLVAIYQFPLFLRKYMENKDLNLYLTMLKSDETSSFEMKKDFVTDFVYNFIYTSKAVYKKSITILLWLLVLNVGAFIFFDLVLQNRFMGLVPYNYPFKKWPDHFNGTMSIHFPPFVECSINRDMMIIAQREEKIGCRLTLMPLYEKTFIILWFFFVILFFATVGNLIFYFVMGMFKRCRKNLIYIVREELNIKYCIDTLTVGDIMVLNSLKNVVSSELFRHALREVRRVGECTKSKYEVKSPDRYKENGYNGFANMDNKGYLSKTDDLD